MNMLFLNILLLLVPSPEKLIFDARFGPLPIGEITLHLEKINGLYKITCEQITHGWLSPIHRINDRYEIWMDTTFKPLLYKARIEQGRFKRDRKIAFYHHKEIAVYNDQDTVSLARGAREIFSLIYYIRAISPSCGDTIRLMLHDGKKNREIVVPITQKQFSGETYLVATPIIQGIKIFGGEGLTLYYDQDMVPSILSVGLRFGHIKAIRR
ncbi:DUF3108 domain-containing protein [candidate division WOR-3 bacterium]|nr:DUF3108 domain-containing protein [candidate division WOR-3 bacterium]